MPIDQSMNLEEGRETDIIDIGGVNQYLKVPSPYTV